MHIRNYNPDTDYLAVESLYKDSDTFGGKFDTARDNKDKLDALEKQKPGSILVVEIEGQVAGSVTLFEDGRTAWLYRFAVIKTGDKTKEAQTAAALWAAAKVEMKQRGHSQVLVYAPANNPDFAERYTEIGFTKGENYTAYWQNL